jgi:hypothetical protein
MTVLGLNAQENNIKYMFQSETGIAFSPRSYTIHQTFINGITIAKQHSIGFGLGIGEILADENSGIALSMPIFLNYRCNFLNPKRSPFINVAAGTSLRKSSPQFYSSITAGLQIYNFSISSGVLFQTINNIQNNFLPAIVVQIGIRL